MEKPFKEVHGKKLYPRTCSVCKVMDFWVEKKSKQETCGSFCEQIRRKKAGEPALKFVPRE